MLSFDVVLQIVANLVQSGRFLLGALAKIDEDNQKSVTEGEDNKLLGRTEFIFVSELFYSESNVVWKQYCCQKAQRQLSGNKACPQWQTLRLPVIVKE